MIVVMDEGVSQEQIESVIDRLTELGFGAHRSTEGAYVIIGAIGPRIDFETSDFAAMPGVREVVRVSTPYRMASRSFRPTGTVVKIGAAEFSQSGFEIIVSIPHGTSSHDLETAVETAVSFGCRIFYGTITNSSGPHQSNLASYISTVETIRRLVDNLGAALIVEVDDRSQIATAARFADSLAVAPGSMENYALLKSLGDLSKPVVLNKAQFATVEECLLAAEHVLMTQNFQVVLCGAAIRTFVSPTHTTMDVSAIPALKTLSHLPVIAAPSRTSVGRARICAMARAATAAGANGLVLEVHPAPAKLVTGGAHAIDCNDLKSLIAQLQAIRLALLVSSPN